MVVLWKIDVCEITLSCELNPVKRKERSAVAKNDRRKRRLIKEKNTQSKTIEEKPFAENK